MKEMDEESIDVEITSEPGWARGGVKQICLVSSVLSFIFVFVFCSFSSFFAAFCLFATSFLFFFF